MCNIEFPHFGASYPDAHCINGYLWDMDSYENGCYTIGGDDPCHFCNTEAWLKTVLDNEEFASREEALEWVEKMREKWGAEHLADTRKTSPKDLEEAAEDFGKRQGLELRPFANKFFIAGAKWDREQMMNEAVEGEIAKDNRGNNVLRVGLLNNGFEIGDKVRIIIINQDEK